MFLVLGDLVVQIPMPVLAGIMIIVAIGTFDWSSFSYLRKAPRSDAIVMLTTVAVVVVTDNLALGVVAGILLSAVFFAAQISSIGVQCEETPERIGYTITGQLFFASVEGFVNVFDFTQTDTDIIIDFTEAHIWDDSGVGAVDRVVIRLRQQGNRVTVKGLNAFSEKMINRLAVYQDAGTRIKSH